MEGKIDYSSIWKLSVQEDQTNELQPLSKDFYDKSISLINQIKDPEMGRSPKANFLKLLNKLFEKRKQKITIYAAYNKPLPNPIPKEEQDLYVELITLLKGVTLNKNPASAEHPYTKEASTERGDAENVIEQPEYLSEAKQVKALQDMPELLLPSGNKVGPANKGDIIKISNENDIKFLISNSLCEYSS